MDVYGEDVVAPCLVGIGRAETHAVCAREEAGDENLVAARKGNPLAIVEAIHETVAVGVGEIGRGDMETCGGVWGVVGEVGGVVNHRHALLETIVAVEDFGDEGLGHAGVEGYIAGVDNIYRRDLTEIYLTVGDRELVALIALVVEPIIVTEVVDIAVVEVDVAYARTGVEPYYACGIGHNAIHDT